MNEAVFVIVLAVVVVFTGFLASVVTDSETVRQCDAFGKTFLNGKVYVCTKQQ